MPSHTSGAAMPEEKKGSMSQISIAPSLPSRTSLAQPTLDRPRSWSCHLVMDTFSCGLGGCGNKLSSQPEHALKQLSTKPTGTSWGSSPAASQRKSPESLRGHGPSAHMKPAALLQQHLPVCSTLHQHTGQSPAGESISVPTTRDSSHH